MCGAGKTRGKRPVSCFIPRMRALGFLRTRRIMLQCDIQGAAKMTMEYPCSSLQFIEHSDPLPRKLLN